MTPDQITLIEESWKEIRPVVSEVPAIFYARLFEIAPELRTMFDADLTGQGVKLTIMLGLVVGNLRNLDTLLPMAADLAHRHVGYNVRPEHYAVVGEALIWALDQKIEGGLDDVTERAWTDAYALLSGEMIRVAYAPV